MMMMVTPTGVKKEKGGIPAHRTAPHLRLRTANRYDRGAGRDWVLELLPFFHTHTHSTIESPVHPRILIRKLDKRGISVSRRTQERKGKRKKKKKTALYHWGRRN